MLGRPRVVSRALRCGASRGPACTPRRKRGSRPGSVARALGVQSRTIWQVVMGSCSATPDRSGPWKPHVFLFFFFALSSQLQPSITPSHKLSSSLLCDSHGTSAVAHQALPVVTATDGASLSVRVCAMFPVALRIKNEDVISRAGQEIGHCEEGQDDVKPTLRDFKGTQSHGTRYNSIAALQALAFDMRTCKHYHISTYF